jgi:membrane protein DedA with SNARE-associated domain
MHVLVFAFKVQNQNYLKSIDNNKKVGSRLLLFCRFFLINRSKIKMFAGILAIE